ncbi:MAG: LamG domain-containing protein [Planctomycetes bacterium]|nr:LamG domain-containing protein [Planctomycetota bacterium]
MSLVHAAVRRPSSHAALVLLALAAGASGQSFPADPVAHWAFDELAGTLVREHVAQLDGTALGAWADDGVCGNARAFDGVDDMVVLPQTALAAIGALPQGSLSVWFEFEEFTPFHNVQPIVYMGIDDTAQPDDMLVVEVGHRTGPEGNHKLYITWVVDDVLPLCFDTGFDLDFGRWYHFVAVVGPQGNTGYLDGVELVDRHYNFGGPDDSLFFADIPDPSLFAFGYGKTSDAQTLEFLNFHGRVDEVRVYDRPLSAGEVAVLHEVESAIVLAADDLQLEASTGGDVNLLVDVGPEHAGEQRFVLAGLSGSSPGITLPGPWQVVLPLNWDAFTDLLVANLGAAPFEDFVDTLDADGRGTATLHLPPLPPGTEATFTFAFALKPWTLASNPVEVRLVDA